MELVRALRAGDKLINKLPLVWLWFERQQTRDTTNALDDVSTESPARRRRRRRIFPSPCVSGGRNFFLVKRVAKWICVFVGAREKCLLFQHCYQP